MMRPLIVTAVLFISPFALGVSSEGLLSAEVSTWTEKQEDEDFQYWRELLDAEENMSVPTAAPVPSNPPEPLTPSPLAPTTAPIPSPTQPPSTPPLTPTTAPIPSPTQPPTTPPLAPTTAPIPPPTQPPTTPPLTPTTAPIPSPTQPPTTPPLAPTTAPIPPPTQSPPTPPPVPVDGDDACSPSNLQALEDAKQQWDDSGIVSYRYVFNQIGFIFPSGPLEIEVANCTVESATFLMEPNVDATNRASTIEQLFAVLEQFLSGCPDNGPDSYQVSFNPELGYPVNVNIDPDFAAQDEELIYSVSDFIEVARSPTGCNGL